MLLPPPHVGHVFLSDKLCWMREESLKEGVNPGELAILLAGFNAFPIAW
jgi:hypothetical protein